MTDLLQLSTDEDGKDICLFCGNPPTEHFHSGSHETYNTCECPQSQAWYAALKAVEDIEAPAKARQRVITANIRVRKATHEMTAAVAERVDARTAQRQYVFLSP